MSGNDPDYISSMEHFESMRHEEIYAKTQQIDAAQILNASVTWLEVAGTLATSFPLTRASSDRVMNSMEWEGAAADAAYASARSYAESVDELAAIMGQVGARLGGVAAAAEAVKIAVIPPGTSGPIGAIAKMLEAGGIIDAQMAEEALRQEAVLAMNMVYKPAYGMAGTGIPALPDPPQLPGAIAPEGRQRQAQPDYSEPALPRQDQQPTTPPVPAAPTPPGTTVPPPAPSTPAPSTPESQAPQPVPTPSTPSPTPTAPPPTPDPQPTPTPDPTLAPAPSTQQAPPPDPQPPAPPPEPTPPPAPPTEHAPPPIPTPEPPAPTVEPTPPPAPPTEQAPPQPPAPTLDPTPTPAPPTQQAPPPEPPPAPAPPAPEPSPPPAPQEPQPEPPVPTPEPPPLPAPPPQQTPPPAPQPEPPAPVPGEPTPPLTDPGGQPGVTGPVTEGQDQQSPSTTNQPGVIPAPHK
ncbi:hypothetical protein ACLMAJ_25420 [Nocardia sp. KC 131]|uniref:hypothetical protein n=1 Tax=Nocardia arseniciresistens TaxID=3392119 RepID=UPI00398EE86D